MLYALLAGVVFEWVFEEGLPAEHIRAHEVLHSSVGHFSFERNFEHKFCDSSPKAVECHSMRYGK